MMELMEQPWTIGGLGVLLVVILFSGWVKTGHAALIPAFILAGLLFGGLLLVERLVQTEKEQVTGALYDILSDVEGNDLPAVLQHIHSTAKPLREEAQSYMPRFHFTEAHATDVKSVTVEQSSSPPRAKIEFTVRARVEESMDRRAFMGFIVLQMQKEDDRWRVTSYEKRPFEDSMKRSDATRLD